jgi:formylglycine-generating enzyme required for sulfatase activity
MICPDGTSCCQSTVIPAGTFVFGSQAVSASGMPGPTVMVETFALDVHLTTIGRFRKFVNAYDGTPPAPGAGANPAVPGTGWDASWNSSLPKDAPTLVASLHGLLKSPDTAWTDAVGPDELKPITGVDWFTAFAFCVWDGGRLPGSAEYAYAAGGGAEGRSYPWGNTAPDDTVASSMCGWAAFEVDHFPAGRAKWGQFDLTTGPHVFNFDAGGPAGTMAVPCPNPECSDMGTQPFDSGRVVRGAGCLVAPNNEDLMSDYPESLLATDHIAGVRCARNP